MKDIRTTRSNLVNVNLAVAAIALLALGLAAYQAVSTGKLAGFELHRPQAAQLAPPATFSAQANPEGMAIYRQSEHMTPARFHPALGLAIYHDSEWHSAPALKANPVGMAIYRQSETGTPATIRVFNPVGWAIYFASEKGR